MEQPTLPFQPHSDTSKAAAREMRPKAKSIRQDVWFCIYRAGMLGRTDEEIQAELNISPNTSRPRRVELVHMGMVVDSGVRRKTSSGSKATVWRAVPHEDMREVREDVRAEA